MKSDGDLLLWPIVGIIIYVLKISAFKWDGDLYILLVDGAKCNSSRPRI